jgi:hypothetical protein
MPRAIYSPTKAMGKKRLVADGLHLLCMFCLSMLPTECRFDSGSSRECQDKCFFFLLASDELHSWYIKLQSVLGIRLVADGLHLLSIHFYRWYKQVPGSIPGRVMSLTDTLFLSLMIAWLIYSPMKAKKKKTRGRWSASALIMCLDSLCKQDTGSIPGWVI